MTRGDGLFASCFLEPFWWIRVAATSVFLFSLFISSRGAERPKSHPTRVDSGTPVPPDCDKPELLADGRPSMMPVGVNLAFGFSVTEHEFKVGNPIKLHVWVDNSGDDPVGVRTCDDLDRFKAQGFDLVDADGRRLLNRQDAKVAEECKTNPQRANFHRGVWICTRNFPITIPAHTCVTRDDYDFTTELVGGYDLPTGKYTLRMRTNWRVAEDVCERQSAEPIQPQPADITFSVGPAVAEP